MGIIHIEGMEFYAYHGHYKEEQIIGNKFIVELKMEVETKNAENSDDINDAVDYRIAYKTVHDEMAQASHLLEHVAGRILHNLYKNLEGIQTAEIKISKLNPPMDGKIDRVSVILKQ